MATAQGFDPWCQICTNTYSTVGQSRCLPCGHTLCTECLEQHIISTVRESKFRCPFCNKAIPVRYSGQEDHVTLAEMFPVNFMLADVIERMENQQIQNSRAHLGTDWDSLNSTNQFVENKLKYERRQLLQGLDLSVAQTTAAINSAAVKLIKQLTAAVRAVEDSKLNELRALHETARGKVEGKFNKIKSFLNNSITFLNSCESLLNDIKISESSIKSKRNHIQQLKTPLTDYLDTPRLESQETKITFNKSMNATENICINIGSIKLTDIDEQTVGNPASDKMELVKVIETGTDWLYGIDVLDVLGSLKIIVASYMNSCIKCYNCKDGKQHCMYETSSRPRGLVTLRDGRVVIVVNDSKILFMTVNQKIIVTKSVKTEKQYNMITQLTNSNLAVSVLDAKPGCVHILNLNCDVIRSISNLSPYPFYLTESRSGVVVVCSGDQSVSCVMSHHNWVTSRDTSGLKYAWGITFDRSGFIYVVDCVRHLVVQLDSNGKYLRDVITCQNGLCSPLAVCFHSDKLYITEFSGKIKIFTFEENKLDRRLTRRGRAPLFLRQPKRN